MLAGKERECEPNALVETTIAGCYAPQFVAPLSVTLGKSPRPNGRLDAVGRGAS